MAATEPWASSFEKRAQAGSFDVQAAAQYARLRPGYPAATIDAAVPSGARRVLDLAAGTGELTGPLLERGLDVVAVEPLWGMLCEFGRGFPRASAVCGAAEDIPLADSAMDAVMVGQAFHWFNPDQALSEITRVLRPGGRQSLLWDHDEEADPLVRDVEAALARAGRPPGGSTGRGSAAGDPPVTGTSGTRGSGTPPFRGHPSFADPKLTEIAWRRELTIDEEIGLLNTYYYVIRASDQARSELDIRVREILNRHCPGRTIVAVPVICQVWRSTCR